MVAPHPRELADVPLFADLSEDQRAELASRFDVEEFAENVEPAHIGKHGYAFFVLAQGRAHAEFDGQLLEQLEPGSVFGEVAFFAPDSRRTATVVPDTAIRVFSMFGTQFRAMQLEYPEIARRIEELAAVRIARTDRLADSNEPA